MWHWVYCMHLFPCSGSLWQNVQIECSSTVWVYLRHKLYGHQVLAMDAKIAFLKFKCSKTFGNINLFPIYFSWQPKCYTFYKGICFCCPLFVKLEGPEHGSRRDIGLFGSSTRTTVHKNNTFIGTEIVIISLIIDRFWWSFFYFLCENQDYLDLARNHPFCIYKISQWTPYHRL